jgi:EAL and modified HD-GYP domain-containing signal transduction protein
MSLNISEDKSLADQVLLARQPICGPGHRTFGYELLYRNSTANRSDIQNGEQATARVILDSFTEIGLERIVGQGQAFINITREFIVGNLCRSLPKEKVVLEVLEDTDADSETLRALAALSQGGYKIALDDFVFDQKSFAFLPLCDFVKVDLRQIDRSTMERELPALRQRNLKLLAEKVESYEEYEFCKSLGFEYFQGYFFCQPNMLAKKKIPVNRVAVFQLLARLQDPNVAPSDLISIISNDLSLSYKLMRYINSAYFALPKKIESLHHAVRLVGTDRIRMLADLIMLASLGDKPSELTVTALVRARMCESIASMLGFKNKEAFFTVGLFSCLDAFLDCDMAEALQSLPLSDEMKNALLHRSGLMGKVLSCVLFYENARWERLDVLRLDREKLRAAYLDSIAWSSNLVAAFAS